MAKQKFSKKKVGGVAKKRTAAEQQVVDDRRSHKGMTLNAWKPADMEAAVKW